MAGQINTYGRLLIVNGQPIFLKDIGLNSSQSFTSDILQQALNDVTSDPLTHVMDCNTNDTPTLNSGLGINVVNDDTGSEYVTELVNDQNVEDTSTIRLTIEQASELGLHFTMENLNQNISLCTDQKGSIEDSSKQTYTIADNTSSSNTPNNSAKMKCNSLQEVEIIDKIDDNNTLLESLQPASTTSNQELSILPQFVDGAVTYTLQLPVSNEILSQTNNSELFRITESSVITEDSEQVEGQLRYDLTALSNSSDLPFLDVVPNKFTDNSVQNLNESDTSNHTYGLVSCNSENITFLSLSGSNPVGSSISNIIRPKPTQNNHSSTQQSNLFNNVCHLTDAKTKIKMNHNQCRESLIVKQRVSSQQNGIRLKTKTKTDKAYLRHGSCISSTKNSTIDNLDSHLDVTAEFSQANKCIKKLSILEKTQTEVDSPLNDDLLTSLSSISG